METAPALARLVNRVVAPNMIGRLTPLLTKLQLPLPVAPPTAGEQLWLDRPDFEQIVVERTTDQFLRHHARNLARDGFTHIPGSIAPALCDEVVRDFHSYCARHAAEAAKYADGYGQHSRLCNLHMESAAALSIALDETIMRLLDFLFGRRAAAFSSLVFEKGSQQAIHRDGPYFHTAPAGFFFGVWTALEDVSEAAGPLIYLRGGHRIPLSPSEAARRHAEEKPPQDLGTFYNLLVARKCEEHGLKPESPTMRKGDTLIWHPDLPHGGRPILDRSRTRKSLVVHYGPEGTPVYGPEVFFGGAPTTVQMPYWRRGSRAYANQGQPVFHENH